MTASVCVINFILMKCHILYLVSYFISVHKLLNKTDKHMLKVYFTYILT
jgi:hypothetical protein